MFESLLKNLNESIENFDFIIAGLVFVFYFFIDMLYAKYTLSITKLEEYKAASTGVMIYVLTAYGIINYTQNWLYIFPLAAGSWIGTVYIIKREKNKSNK